MIGLGLRLRRRRIASGGGGGGVAPAVSTPYANITVNRAASGTQTIPLTAGFTGSGPMYYFMSTPVHGCDIVGSNLILTKSALIIGPQQMIVWAWNASGVAEAAPFTITVEHPLTLTTWQFGTLDKAGEGRVQTSKLAGGPLSAGLYVGMWGSLTVDASGYAAATTNGALVAGTGYTVGSVTVPMTVRTGEVFVDTDAQLQVALASANSGKTVNIRGQGASGRAVPINITTSFYNGKFDGLTSVCTIQSADPIDPVVIDRMSIATGGGTPKLVTLKNLTWYFTNTLVERNSGLVVNGTVWQLLLTNVATDITIDGCDFISNAPIARLTFLRQANLWPSIRIISCLRTTIQNCRFTYTFSPLSFEQDAFSVTFDKNDARLLFNDAWFSQVADSAGNLANFTATNNFTTSLIGDDGNHMDIGGQWAPVRAGFGQTASIVRGNIGTIGVEGALGSSWTTLEDLPGLYTPVTTSQAPALSPNFKYQMDATAGNLTLTLPPLAGVGTAWVTATAYIVGDVVRANAGFWRCISAHTSSASFATDQLVAGTANDRWTQLVSGFQKQFKAGTVTILPPTGTINYVGSGNVASIVTTVNGHGLRFVPNSTTDQWLALDEVKGSQGIFTGNPPSGFFHTNTRVDHNIIVSTTKPLDWRQTLNSSFEANTLMPFLAGDLYNRGTANDWAVAFDPTDAHGSFLTGAGLRVSGNAMGQLTLGGVLVPNDPLNKQLWTVSAGKTYATMAANFNAPPRPFSFAPITKQECIDLYRAKVGGPLYRTGNGAGLGEVGDEANDKYNFATGAFTNNRPWYPVNLVVTLIAGGFTAAWQAPGYSGDGAITAYKLEYQINGGAWVDLVVGTATTGLYDGAAVGNVINVRCAAQNANGYGPSVQFPTSITVVVAKATKIPALTLLHAQNFSGGGNGGDTTQYETTGLAIAPSGNWPLVVFVDVRTSATAAATVDSVTLGTAARAYGTGTAITQSIIAGMSSGNSNTMIFAIPNPAATAGQTLQFDINKAGNGCYIAVYEAVDGAVPLIGATAAAAATTSTTKVVNLTTTGANSKVAYLGVANAVVTITGSDTTLFDRTAAGAGTINAACVGFAMTEQAATIATYTGTFTLGSSLNVAVAAELLGTP